MIRKFYIGAALRLLALTVLVALVWCFVRDRLSAENWRVPPDYVGDSPQVMGWIKAASEGDYIPFGSATITRLNAPYQAEWNDFPMYERVLIFGLGVVVKMVGIFPACNVAVLLGYVLSAISFYLCCRFLKYSKIWSFVGAVPSRLLYYHFWRGLGHLAPRVSPISAAVGDTRGCWIIVSGMPTSVWATGFPGSA